MKIAYDGSAFHGQARQPGLRTVEGEVVQALTRARAIRDIRTSRFQSASRTDRGVSALGNVVAFDSLLSPKPTVRSFNAKARGVWAWAVASVPPDFSARRARERRYEYVLPGRHDERALDAALGIFIGEHDFRNFTRDRERTVLRIDAAHARREGDSIFLDFRAHRFAWNLVRRLVAAALLVESGSVPMEDVERALGSRAKADFGLAPPEPLLLVDVVYDIEFERVVDPTTHDRVQRILADHLRGVSFFAGLAERLRMEDSASR